MLLIAALSSAVLFAQAPSQPTGLAVSVGTSTGACTTAANAGLATYVRQGATGTNNGSSWTNALTTPPTTLTRGRTYCLADTVSGFGQWKITSHAAGTAYTRIVKATIADHGTSAGWLDAMGDGQATFTAGVAYQGTFDYNVPGSGYLEVNGNGTPITCGAKVALAGGSQTGCGLRFINTAGTGQSFNWHGGGFNGIVRYVDLQGPSGTTTGAYDITGDAQGYAVWGASPAGENALIQYNYIHNSVTLGNCTSGDVYEYNYFANNRINGDVDSHGNVIYCGFGARGVTFRYNYAANYNDEGFFITFFGGSPSNIVIHGNVFYSPGTVYPRGVELREGGLTSSGIIVNNNTFVNLTIGGIHDRSGDGGSCSGCTSANNISYAASNAFSGMSSSNNTDDNTNRFVALGSNFHLSAALAGMSLSATYQKDLAGTTRGGDGVWDRGAYEYCAGGC